MDIEDSPEVKAERTRWQNAIYERCKKAVGPENDYVIDGGGCDSGDPLDFTLAEIGQAIGFWQDKAEELADAPQVPRTEESEREAFNGWSQSDIDPMIREAMCQGWLARARFEARDTHRRGRH